MQSAYAACLLQVLSDAPYPEAWSPTEPLKWRARGSLESHKIERFEPRTSGGSSTTGSLARYCEGCKARADVADDAYEAIGHLTQALGASPSNASLLAQERGRLI